MIHLLIPKLDGRHPTATERAAVQSFLATATDRFTALDEVRTHHKAIVEEMIVEMKRLYPRFAQYHPYGFDKGQRDMELLLAFAAKSAVLGETETLDNGLIFWFRSILKSVHMTPQFMHDSFRLCDEGLKKRLTPRSYELVKVVWDHITKMLVQLPEPPHPEGGDRRDAREARPTKAARAEMVHA